MNKSIIIILILLLLPGCALFGGKPDPVIPIQVEKRVQPIPVFHPPLPEGVAWQEVKWRVLTPETMAEYLKDLEEGNAPVDAWYSITPATYEALSQNVAELKRYIIQQNALLIYYRKNLVEIVIEQVDVPVKEEADSN